MLQRRALFIDRDGTIVVEPLPDKQLDGLEKLSFIPGAIQGLARLAALDLFDIVLVSNQDGLGTSLFPEDTFWPSHDLIVSTLRGEGVTFIEECIDRSLPNENKPTRKPQTEMLTRYMNGNYDLKKSFVIGDRTTDVELAINLGAQAIFLSNVEDQRAALSTDTWRSIADYIENNVRASKVTRKTKETEVSVILDLDGTGYCHIQTGIPFFNHMLELFSAHSMMDLKVDAKGDLPHHIIEDVAIVIGTALSKALANKAGVRRAADCNYPMDDALARVALDLSGRGWLNWKADFNFEQVEGMPTKMFFHFFKSLCDNAKCCLNIEVVGEDEHHKIEAVFKAVAHALRLAAERDPRQSGIPSTKGIL